MVCAHGFDDKFRDMGNIHMRMCDFLDLRRSPSRSKYLSAFRGSFKTTVLLGYFAWFFLINLARGKSNSITYNTAIKENAWNFQNDVRFLLCENDLLKWIFPELPEEKHFDGMTKNRIDHKRVRLDFTSTDTTQASKHTNNMVNDDLENEKNYQTEGQRNDLINAFMYQQSVLMKVKSKGLGLDIFVGTPYHLQGLTWRVRNDATYDHLEIPCYVDRDMSKGVTFPERYTVDDFETIRARQNNQVFQSQYLLYPLSELEVLCLEDWLQTWERLPENRWRTMVIDPGGSQAGVSDPTGITIVDTDEAGDMFVVVAEEHFLTPMNLIDKINDMKKLYMPDDIRIEKEKYSITIADMFQHKFPLMHVSYVEHKGRKKEDRIWRLKQLFQGRRIWIGKNQPIFRKQLLEYPHVSHDDILDSLSYHIDIRRVPAKGKKLHLPSGREFVPNIAPDFEKEMNDALAFSANSPLAEENDHAF